MIGSARGCVDEAAITVYTVESARLMSRLNSRLERRLQALACACGVSAHARCPIGAMWQHPTKVQNILKPVKKKRRRRTRHDPRPRHIRYPCTMPCSARNGTRGRGRGGRGGWRHAGAAQSGCPHTATLDGVREARSHSQSQSRLCGTAARAMPMRIEPRPIAFAVQFGFSAWCVTLTVR